MKGKALCFKNDALLEIFKFDKRRLSRDLLPEFINAIRRQSLDVNKIQYETRRELFIYDLRDLDNPRIVEQREV